MTTEPSPPTSTRPSPTTIRAWARLLRAQQAALSHVESAFKAAGLPPLAWYDVLLELDRVGENGLRPFELERETLLPQYGLSRLIDRIEAAGYVERQRCVEDGRGQRIVITTAGSAVRRQAWPVYAAAIEQAVGSRLTEDDTAALDRLLGKLLPEA